MGINSKEKIIDLDFDGVIFDHSLNKLKLAKKFGAEITLADTASDIYTRKVRETLNPGDLKRLNTLLYDDPSVALRAVPVRGVEEGVDFIKRRGLPYFIISRRKSAEIPIELLKIHGLWPKYFGKYNVFIVREDSDKDPKAMEFGINVFLDDRPTVLETLKSVSDKFLFDPMRAYNEFNGDYKKVYSWQEFINQLS